MAARKRPAREYADTPASHHADENEETRERAHRAVRLVDCLDEHPLRAPRAAEATGVEISSASATRLSAETASASDAVPSEGTPRLPSPDGDDGGVGRAVPAPPVGDGCHRPEGAYAIRAIHPTGDGDTVTVVLSVPASEGELCADGRGEAPPKSFKKVKVHLTVEQYADRRLCVGSISPETAAELMEAGNLCDAIRRGMNLLQYGDRSERRLAYQLAAKGFERSVAEAAAAYLNERGYIREDTTALRRVEQNLQKGWGPRRIREDLRAQGFTAEAVEDAMELLADVDFVEQCAAVIRKKYRTLPRERVDRQKAIAALMRLGYDTDTAREALRRVLREERP